MVYADFGESGILLGRECLPDQPKGKHWALSHMSFSGRHFTSVVTLVAGGIRCVLCDFPPDFPWIVPMCFFLLLILICIFCGNKSQL